MIIEKSIVETLGLFDSTSAADRERFAAQKEEEIRIRTERRHRLQCQDNLVGTGLQSRQEVA
jgi:hypothetical protein